MSPKKKELIRQDNSMASALVDQLNLNSELPTAYRASDMTKLWRYIDFINPRQKVPCLALEWLVGCRGLLAGRIINLRAKPGTGKSAFMWLMYACGQRTPGKSWCYHIESEATPPPDDFIAQMGCDPRELTIDHPGSLENCFEKLDTVIATVRGGFGGALDPDTGRQRKTTFTAPLDKNLVSPIVVGIDSFSALGIDTRTNQDVLDLRKTSSLGEHARKMAEYLRDRSERFKASQVLLMLASQEKAKIKTGGPMQQHGGPDVTSLGESPIAFHATWCLDLAIHAYRNKEGEEIGDRITLRSTKNKLSPKHRVVDLYLVRNKGFDLLHADAEFLLLHSASPLKGRANRTSAGVKCPELGDKTFKSDEDFLMAVYGNAEFLRGIRETMRIRGFGFKFETDYMAEFDDKDDAPAEVGDGLEGSQGTV